MDNNFFDFTKINPLQYQDFNLSQELSTNNNFDFDKCIYKDYRCKNDKSKFIDTYQSKEDDILIYDKKIHDNILFNIYNFILKCKWEFHNSTPDTVTFFRCNLINNLYFNKLFYDYIIPKINLDNKNKLKISRSYINLNMPLSCGFWHTDGPGFGPTILIYLNLEWKTHWEGQTQFYTDYKNLITKYIDVIPGRIIIFKPYIKHRASDMSIYAIKENVFRYTLAYHTYYEQ